MTRSEAEEAEAWLQQARRSLAPNLADRARVRVALGSALAAPLPSSAATRLGNVGRILARRLPALALVGVVAGGAGYWLGYHAASQTRPARVSEPQLQRAARTPAALVPPPAAQAQAPAAVGDRQEPRDSGARTGSGSMRRADPNAPPDPRSTLGEQLPEVQLDEELRTLRRAEHAQREGNPRLALVLLEELSQSTRGGKLLEEREAEAVVARCALEPEQATALRSAFERTHPASVYLERIKHSCGSGAE